MAGTPRRGIGAWETIAVLAAVAVLSAVTALPKTKTEYVRTTGAAGNVQPGIGQPNAPGVSQGPNPIGNGGNGNTSNPTLPGQICAPGRNGGATDVGVTGETIKLGATVVDSGIGAAFLSDVRYGMLAVVNKINEAGGVCGRRLSLVLKDDGWQPSLGSQFIQDLVDGEKVFALAVVPSSEGLRIVSKNGYLRNKGVPVVGSDGMLITQYTDPVIWPVAASTITVMHVMAKNAYDRGARHFSIVYDANYHFGVEGAYAFNAAVKRLTGHDIPGYSNPLTSSPGCSGGRFCGIKAGQPSYQTELQAFKSSCNAEPRCDYVAYLLEPSTAQVWMQGGGIKQGTGVEIGGPQPLFNRSFGVNCASNCHGMWVWTGFVPPVEPFTATPPVAAFLNAMRSTNANADPSNSFVQGGYLGMKLLVEALQRVGPNLTRKALISTLNHLRFDVGLSRPLSWRSGNHFANQCVMGFSIQARPSFAGWRNETDYICDPWPGLDVPPASQQ